MTGPSADELRAVAERDELEARIIERQLPDRFAHIRAAEHVHSAGYPSDDLGLAPIAQGDVEHPLDPVLFIVSRCTRTN